jgi:branched-chain amino acid transport system ATP-binding protein
MSSLLTVQGLTIRFGGINALSDVSFEVEEGHITGLIGPNGAGKTTCFNCITRLYQPTSGEITFQNHNLLRLSAQQIVNTGIARTFQNVALFDNMTTLENVLVGAHARQPDGFGGKAEKRAKQRALDLLDEFGMSAIAHRPVRGLPFGIRKNLELVRALMAEPKLLLLDEPASGLSHGEVAELGTTIQRIAKEFHTTILMVEHHMHLVMGTCDHIVVLASGKKLADGPPETIQKNAAVIEAYLGAV